MSVYGPLQVSDIVARLQAQVTTFKNVAPAVDLAAIEASQMPDLGAYVLLGSEHAAPLSGASGAYRQQVWATVGVLIVVRNYAADVAAGVQADLATLITATRTSLLGYITTGALGPLELVDGRIVTFTPDGAALWLERYRAPYWLQNP